MNGVFFHDLYLIILNLKMECSSSLVELWLIWKWYEEEPIFIANRLLDMVNEFKSLKKLSITIFEDLEKENKEMIVPLFKLFQRLPNLEFLYIGGKFSLVRNNFYDNLFELSYYLQCIFLLKMPLI